MLKDIEYDLQFTPMSLLRRAQLECQRAQLYIRQGNPLALARWSRLLRVLYRVSRYNYAHDHCFERFDREVEERLYGPRTCQACQRELPAEWWDLTCKECQRDN